MSSDRIVLRRLVLMGSNVPDAAIGFERGLNVISGASDTGKSYVFGCLDYMLGGRTPPKPIPEATRYDRSLLQVEDGSGKQYTLSRSLEGGDFELHARPIADIDPFVAGRILRGRHAADGDDSVSRFLLSLIGIADDVRLRKNSQNATQSLSFRNVCTLALASEERIIAEDSPIYSGHSTAKTVEASAFLFLLTGQHAGTLAASGDLKTRKALWLAQYNLYGTLISELNQQIAAAEDSAQSVQERLRLVDARIDEASERLSRGGELLDEALAQKRAAVADEQAASCRVVVIEGLLARFDVLREHYESDLARLRFLAEGNHYLAQVHLAPCPVCGTEVSSDQIGDGLGGDGGTVEQVVEGCHAEAEKILASLHDLADTTESLRTELEQVSLAAAEAEARTESAESKIQETLEPILLAGRRELDALALERRLLAEYESNRARRTEFIQRRFALGSEPRQTRQASADVPDGQAEALAAFGGQIQAVLADWQYARRSGVEFDKEFDVALEGTLRRSHGKGIRAIIRSAYMIALMRYCAGHDRPHPRFVVLDSPLTTYRGAVHRDQQAGEDLPTDVQEAFFRTLAASGDAEQVIVFDNKEPPDDLKPNLAYTQFTGQPGPGRPGFFPDL